MDIIPARARGPAHFGAIPGRCAGPSSLRWSLLHPKPLKTDAAMNPQPAPFVNLTAMKKARRIIVAVLGGTVLALGIALIVLPGPAFLVIPAGLAILAIEFAWAKRWLRSARALMPHRSKDASSPQKKFTLQSVRRSAGFLLRQVRRALLPNRKGT